MAARTISINRAPVMTLWAAVVAQRLGFDEDEALGGHCDQIEVVLRRERVQDLLHGFIGALQLVPLHGERIIEQHHHVVGLPAGHLACRCDGGL